jgi:hypothetical protein
MFEVPAMIKHRIALLIILVLFVPLQAGAQNRAAGWITISAPDQWSDGRTLNATAGRRISISGQAFHRGGIASITVNGRAAVVKEGSNNVSDFTASFTAARGMKGIEVVVKPRTGSVVRKTFAIAVTGPAPVAARTPSAPAERQMTADGAFKRGLLVPGLGQIATDRKPLGAAIMVAGVGALGYGILSTREEIDCAMPADPCPATLIESQKTVRPHLALGIGAYVLLAVAGAFEAKSYAQKNPSRFGYGPVEVLRYATVKDDAVVFELVRVTF